MSANPTPEARHPWTPVAVQPPPVIHLFAHADGYVTWCGRGWRDGIWATNQTSASTCAACLRARDRRRP